MFNLSDFSKLSKVLALASKINRLKETHAEAYAAADKQLKVVVERFQEARADDQVTPLEATKIAEAALRGAADALALGIAVAEEG